MQFCAKIQLFCLNNRIIIAQNVLHKKKVGREESKLLHVVMLDMKSLTKAHFCPHKEVFYFINPPHRVGSTVEPFFIFLCHYNTFLQAFIKPPESFLKLLALRPLG